METGDGSVCLLNNGFCCCRGTGSSSSSSSFRFFWPNYVPIYADGDDVTGEKKDGGLREDVDGL